MKRLYTDAMILGFALFSMFFGAGNVVFPPYLGVESGPEWVLSFLGYYMADIGLALVSMAAMFRHGGAEPILRPLGKAAAGVLMTVVVLCIGPMLAIPRTAATVFEMSIAPYLPIPSLPFSVFFFALVFLLSVRESAVVDIVGKVLTPLLLLGLLALIVRGVLHPLGPVAAAPAISDGFTSSIKAGYQTMDVLSTLLFGVLILRGVEDRGYLAPRQRNAALAGTGLVAGVILLVVYGGLTYLGATVSTLYDTSMGRSALVLAIVDSLFGPVGGVILAVVVALACMTTAIALVSAAADYFSGLSRGRVSYPLAAGLVCLFSAGVANFGLDQLVAIASPVLDLVYPPSLVLIGLSFFSLPRPAVCLAALGALAASGASALGLAPGLMNALPLANLGFGWLLPAAVCGIFGFCLSAALGASPKGERP